MQAMERLSRYISQGVYTVSGPFHPFGGAVDIIVVQQEDGSFKSSPWYVRFGKFQGVLKTREKVVNVSVNGTEAAFHMYLDHKGEAYFLMEADGNDGEGIFSPPLSGDETDGQLQNGQLITAQGVDLSSDQLNSATQIDVGNGKIVARTNSRRSRIFGLMFGRNSIKDNGRLKKGDPTMQRMNSLERAEIAADLLEMKWSTNLPTDNHRVNIASRLSVSETQAEETDAVLQVVDKEEPCIPSVHNSIISSVDNVDNSAEMTSPKNPCLQNHEQILQTSEESTVEGACFDDVSVSGQTALCSQSASFTEPEVVQVSNSGNFANVDTEKAAKGENGDRAFSAYIYSQASITSSIGFDVCGQGDIENQSFSKERGDGVQVYAEVSYSAAELVSEVNSEPDSDVPVVKENLNDFDGLDLGLFRGKNSSESRSPVGKYETEMASEKPIEQGISFESSANDGQMILESSLLDRQLPISDSVESKMVEIIRRDMVDEELGREKTSETVLAEIWENQCEMADSSFSLLISNVERVSSGSSSHVESVPVGMNQIPDGIEEGSQAIHSFSHISNSMDQAREVKDLGDGVNMQEVRVLSAVGVSRLESNASSVPVEAVNSSMSPSNSMEEDQFLFSDSDDFVASGVQYEESISAVSVKVDNQTTEVIVEEHELNGINNVLSLSSNRSFDQETEGIEREHELGGMNHVPPLPSNQSFPTAGSHIADLNQDSLPNASEDLPEKLQARASPINIPETWKGAGGVAHLARSLPNLRGNMHDLEMSDVLQPLSHSLDTSSECSKWGILKEDFASSLNSKLGSESNLAGEHPVADAAVVDTQSTEGKNRLPSSPAVEISLCRHLLFEGMGANAASQAFEAEKVDLKRFSDLGPSVVNNNKLVVRIGGCYFPWDAAAPIVLGMILYGQKPAFEPEGMIAVDQVVRTLEDELPRAIGPSGGSWRLWPFSFRKSKTERSVRSAPADAKCKGTESENNASEMGRYKTSTMKKKKAVRSIVPTSEQLASLNLKDGQNIITFAFSTAMLGRQQVDARIYLWKWNTRIVVSDVDGTITKSDVLGQFMPLVGRDWSQSGVAHLFSAIKDNGYQLLFLSARAISQAYLTRQFLFNLKQDGKALPDGPVVISPDGLFPSLYREVIRRAPHEFKIACLEDIRALFPSDCNPFYAGFGNRDTDEFSYLRVGIPKGKIFIINPRGQIAWNRRVDTKSYSSLHLLVNGMFPAMSSSEQEDYNSWNYWKMPLPDISI